MLWRGTFQDGALSGTQFLLMQRARLDLPCKGLANHPEANAPSWVGASARARLIRGNSVAPEKGPSTKLWLSTLVFCSRHTRHVFLGLAGKVGHHAEHPLDEHQLTPMVHLVLLGPEQLFKARLRT
jgi:hypothetical protein